MAPDGRSYRGKSQAGVEIFGTLVSEEHGPSPGKPHPSKKHEPGSPPPGPPDEKVEGTLNVQAGHASPEADALFAKRVEHFNRHEYGEAVKVAVFNPRVACPRKRRISQGVEIRIYGPRRPDAVAKRQPRHRESDE